MKQDEEVILNFTAPQPELFLVEVQPPAPEEKGEFETMNLCTVNKIAVIQTSANRGHNMTIVDKASCRRLSPKPSRGRVIKYLEGTYSLCL